MLVIGVAAVANYVRFIAKTSAPHKRSNKLVLQFVFYEWNVKDLVNKTLEIEIHLTVCWYKIKFKMYLTQTGGSLMYSCLFLFLSHSSRKALRFSLKIIAYSSEVIYILIYKTISNYLSAYQIRKQYIACTGSFVWHFKAQWQNITRTCSAYVIR